MTKCALIIGDEDLRRAVVAALAAAGMAAEVRVFAAVADYEAAGAGAPLLPLPQGVFRMGGLLDRVTAQMQAGTQDEGRCFGPYCIVPRQLVLEHEDGRAIRLTEKERDILWALWECGGAVLERGELLAQLWGYGAAIETHTLETHIYRLRQKIERDPAAPEYLITDALGYRLEGVR